MQSPTSSPEELFLSIVTGSHSTLVELHKLYEVSSNSILSRVLPTKRGDPNVWKAALQKTNQEGLNLLHIMVKKNDEESIAHLLDMDEGRMLVLQQDKQGCLPIHYAKKQGIMRLLLNNYPNEQWVAKDSSGDTLLHMLIKKGDINLLTKLLEDTESRQLSLSGLFKRQICERLNDILCVNEGGAEAWKTILNSILHRIQRQDDFTQEIAGLDLADLSNLRNLIKNKLGDHLIDHVYERQILSPFQAAELQVRRDQQQLDRNDELHRLVKGLNNLFSHEEILERINKFYEKFSNALRNKVSEWQDRPVFYLNEILRLQKLNFSWQNFHEVVSHTLAKSKEIRGDYNPSDLFKIDLSVRLNAWVTTLMHVNKIENCNSLSLSEKTILSQRDSE